MVPVDSNVESTDEILTALLRAVGRFREKDQAGASAPSGFALYSASTSLGFASSLLRMG